MSLTAAAVVFGTGIAAAWLTARILGRHRKPQPVRRTPGRRYVDAPGFPQPLDHRQPGAAKYAIDTKDARLAHLDAVWAQCTVSPPYVLAMLAGHEPEVTDLLELALELDDQTPKPAPPHDD